MNLDYLGEKLIRVPIFSYLDSRFPVRRQAWHGDDIVIDLAPRVQKLARHPGLDPGSMSCCSAA